MAHLGLKFCCLLGIDSSVSLSRLLYCILWFGFLVVGCCWVVGCPPSLTQFEVLYVWIDLRRLQAKLKQELGVLPGSFSSYFVLLVSSRAWSPLWSALKCFIYLHTCFQPVSPAPLSFPSGARESVCQHDPQAVLGAGDKARAHERAARPWRTVLRTWTQPSLWVWLLIAANYNCKFALKIKFCLKSNFCLGAAL